MTEQVKQPPPEIQSCYETALGLLKPSRKDLEHGLELHRNSLVCDAYGFSPVSPVEPAEMQTLFETGGTQGEQQDLAEERSMLRHLTDPAAREEYRQAWEAAGVTCVVQNAGEEGQLALQMLKRLARFTHVTDRLRDVVARAAHPDDVAAAKAQGKHCLYFTSNGVPLREQWFCVEEELSFIKVFFQLGIRMMHLTYNRRNMLGDGCMEPANGGLSDFGRAAIAEMNRVGVIVDVAHSGWQTSHEAAKASSRPMVASHTVCGELSGHRRGKPENVVRAIVETGGYIGICTITSFLGRSGDIVALLDHIDHVARRFGADHVAIGTDRAHSIRAGREEEPPMSRPPKRKRFENFWHADDPMYDPVWQTPEKVKSMGWTNWPLFTVGLVQRGYSDDDIRKIIGLNVLRVARAALG